MFDWLFNLFKPQQSQQKQNPPAPPPMLAKPQNQPPLMIAKPIQKQVIAPPPLLARPQVQAPTPATNKLTDFGAANKIVYTMPAKEPAQNTDNRIPLQDAIDLLTKYAQDYAKGVGDTLVGAAQAVPRAIKGAGLTLRGEDQYIPEGLPEQIIYGNNPVPNLQNYGRNTVDLVGSFTGNPDAGKGLPTELALPLGLLLAAGDVNPLSGAGKKGAEKAAKEVSGKLAVSVPKEAVAAIPPEIPAPSVAAAGKQKATRFASTTVPESPYVGPEVSKITEANAPLYVPGTNKQQLQTALNSMQTKGIDNHAYDVYERISAAKNGSITPQDAADAATAAQALEVRGGTGDLQRAADIYDRLSSHFTGSGQLIQVASLLSGRSPRGIAFKAEQDLKKNGIEITDAIRKDLNNFREKLGKTMPGTDERGKAVNDLGKYVMDNLPKSKLSSRVVDVWRAGLLSGPITTAGNVAANATSAATKALVSDPIAAFADRFQSLFTKERTKTATLRGSGAGTKEGLQRAGTYLKTGFDKRNASEKYDRQLGVNYGKGPVGKFFKGYTEAIYRWQGSQDQPFYYAEYNRSLNDQALAAAKNQGLKGKEKDAFVQDFVKNPQNDALKIAESDADRATFQNKTKLGEAAAALRKLGPIGEFLVPFTRVPGAVATRLLDNTPLNIAREVVKQVSNVRSGGKYDQRAMSEAIGNGSIGLLLIPVGYALAKAGDIALGYPSDPKEQELWKQEGKQPYSVKVGDQWLSMNYFQPFGTLMAMGGQLQNAKQEGKSDADAGFSALGTAGQSIVNQSFLKGLSGTINAINDPKRYAEQFADNTAGSIVPNLIRTVARATDPLQREINSTGEAIAAGIPGLRQNLTAKTDNFGNQLEAPSSTIDQLINPFRPTTAKATAGIITEELRRLQDSENGILPNNIIKSSLGKDVDLSDQQIQEITNYTGQKLQKAYDAAIRDARYKGLTDAQKADVLSQINRDVVAAYKAEWGVKNNVVTPDKIDLTKAQKSLLEGGQIDWLGEFLKSLQPKPAKKVKAVKVKTTKAPKVRVARGGGSKGSSGGSPRVRVASSRSSIKAPKIRAVRVKAPKIAGFKTPRKVAKVRSIRV